MNKKVLLVGGLIVLLAGFFGYEKFMGTSQTTTQVINNNQQTSGNSNPPQQQTNSNPPPAATTGFKDGTYTGPTINSIYGAAQAQVVITSGQISQINFLQYPQGRRASMQKSNMAMAGIKQEVIQSQSANVNTISGATETSSAFIQSIASALSKAS